MWFCHGPINLILAYLASTYLAGDAVIINDGVSIAKEIELDNEIQDMGASLIKNVASKTNDAVGDSTTLSCVLTQAIVKEGIKMVTVGCNPIQVRQGIQKGVRDVVALISANSKKAFEYNLSVLLTPLKNPTANPVNKQTLPTLIAFLFSIYK